MKKVLSIIGCVLALTFMVRVSQGIVESTSSNERLLAKVAKEMNADLPKQLDPMTRLDTATAGPGNRLNYVYTITDPNVANLGSAQIMSKMKPKLVDGYKTNPNLSEFRKRQVELCYQYRDQNGNPITTIIVSPKDF